MKPTADETSPASSWMSAAGPPVRRRELLFRYRSVTAPVGVVVFVHGHGEHSGRYLHVYEAMAAHGLAAVGFDLRGHGRSQGRRGDVDAFDDFLCDTDAVVAVARQRAGDVPLFLVGHSVGGLIAATYVLDRQPGLAGLVLSSPALGFATQFPGWVEGLVRGLAAVWPSLSVPAGIDPDTLSRDRAVGEAVRADPLTFNRASLRWYFVCRAAQRRILAAAPSITSPTLMVVAGADALVDPAASHSFSARLGASDKQLQVYADSYHELFQEREQTEILELVGRWCAARAAATA